jgi:hypothetical protein
MVRYHRRICATPQTEMTQAGRADILRETRDTNGSRKAFRSSCLPVKAKTRALARLLAWRVQLEDSMSHRKEPGTSFITVHHVYPCRPHGINIFLAVLNDGHAAHKYAVTQPRLLEAVLSSSGVIRKRREGIAHKQDPWRRHFAISCSSQQIQVITGVMIKPKQKSSLFHCPQSRHSRTTGDGHVGRQGTYSELYLYTLGTLTGTGRDRSLWCGNCLSKNVVTSKRYTAS